MRIAIASSDANKISDCFARCAVFIIYEGSPSEIRKLGLRANSIFVGGKGGCLKQNRHPSGKNFTEYLINTLEDCDIIISKAMARDLVDRFQQEQTKIILTSEKKAKKAVERCVKQELLHLPENACVKCSYT